MTTDFALDPDLLYFNHAAVAPWPARTVAAVARFAADNGRYGARDYPAWETTEWRLRERFARLIGARAEDIALVGNTSEALSIIAHGLNWQAGDTVVGIAQEFPSNRIVWQSLAEHGVHWRALDLDRAADPETELLALCDARTRVLAISWVQYARGLRLDLERLSVACRARGILLCVDAIQGLGALPFDLGRMDADFVVADAHKWLLGPEGVALCYCRPTLRAQLRLHRFGWRMVAEPGDFERADWTPAPSARRFECGSPNMLGIHACAASLSLIEELGPVAIEAAIAARIARLHDLIAARGWELLSPRTPERRAGILTFRVPEADTSSLHRALMQQGLICAARGGGIRFSPHYYTPEEQLDRAVALTATTAARLSPTAIANA